MPNNESNIVKITVHQFGILINLNRALTIYIFVIIDNYFLEL